MSIYNQNKELNNFYNRLASSINFKKANTQLDEYIEALNVAENFVDEINLTLHEESSRQIDLNSENSHLNDQMLEYKERLTRLSKDLLEIIEKMTSELNRIQQENLDSPAYNRYLGKLDAYKNWIYDNASLFIKFYLSKYNKILEQNSNSYINEF